MATKRPTTEPEVVEILDAEWEDDDTALADELDVAAGQMTRGDRGPAEVMRRAAVRLRALDQR